MNKLLLLLLLLLLLSLLLLLLLLFIPNSFQGDYGGPLVCRLPGEERWKLFGLIAEVSCGGTRKPNTFTRVAKYLDWIQNILDQEDQTN